MQSIPGMSNTDSWYVCSCYVAVHRLYTLV